MQTSDWSNRPIREIQQINQKFTEEVVRVGGVDGEQLLAVLDKLSGLSFEARNLVRFSQKFRDQVGLVESSTTPFVFVVVPAAFKSALVHFNAISVTRWGEFFKVIGTIFPANL